MINPTNVQVGDKLVFEVEVLQLADEDGDVRVCAVGAKIGAEFFIDPSLAIAHHPAPRPLKVGDRVRAFSQRGTVKAICEGRVWVWADMTGVFFSLPLSDLEPLPNGDAT